MTMLFEIVYATKANGTHHKLAMDALHHIENDDALSWQRLFLKHIDLYLEGSKAPDKEFKDFKNHVLHVGDQFWGGAPEKASAWYDKFVRALIDQQFEEAVYCAGVLSHYYTDPIQPFHTAQCEAENNMQRAVEWSISKSYKMLRKRGLKDYAGLAVETGQSDDWIIEMVQRGATRSHQYYDALITNYNLDRGVVDPLEGLNENCHRFLSELVIYASLGFSRILDRAFLEAAVAPPQVNLTIDTFVASLGIPMRWVIRKLDDANSIKAVQAAYDELQATGRVENQLNEDDREVRALHKREVIERRSFKMEPTNRARSTHRKPAAKAAKIHTKAPAPVLDQFKQSDIETVVAAPKSKERAPRFYLELSDEVEKAPSIGKKTAARLEKIGIKTIEDLLTTNAKEMSEKINTKWISEKEVNNWQYQSRLVCEVAGLRGGQSQILVAAGIKTSRSLSKMQSSELYALLSLFCQTKEGQNLRACESLPDKTKVESWINACIEHPRSVAA